ncbi:MAG: pyridoxal kinase [Ancalomicrobiaceae bacterium]|nr:pyridoxal kinase [Ancalomicrobiaceae bacterium]
MSHAKSAVIVVSSLVTRGSVGGRGAVFALERLGFPVWFVPTVWLPWHPGHGRATRVVTPEAEFAALIDDLIGSKWLGEVGAVITGYFGAPHQVEIAARLIAAVRQANPAALHLCDPVIGDRQGEAAGGLYVPEATAIAIRDQLIGSCDIATPNAFELGWLTGRDVTTTGEAVAAARALNIATTIVTSAPAMMTKSAATLLVTPDDAVQAEHPLSPAAPHGTGDLFAALYLAHRLDGFEPVKALERATASIFDMIVRSVRAGSDELLIAAEQDVIKHSLAQVNLRHIAVPRRPPKPAGRPA